MCNEETKDRSNRICGCITGYANSARTVGKRIQSTNTQQQLYEGDVDISDALDVVAKARLHKANQPAFRFPQQ